MSLQIVVNGGIYVNEVGWALSCADGSTLSGGNPYDGTLILAASGGLCTLSMTDAYGDGWNGAMWTGLGQSITLKDGHSGKKTFLAMTA